ncbi:MAG: MBL fold metallo-hydrolase [Nocardioides sp.]
MSDPVLTFLGAVGSVTGSRFLLDSDQARVLVDAGLFQGLAELRRRNWTPLPVAASSIDAVVLTHAHLDHSGYLPRLVREGFTGRVLCTGTTAELATIVLKDSAHLQAEDAAYANVAGFSRHDPALPLYAAEDVERTIPLFEPVELGRHVAVVRDVGLTLRSAGHILGSSTAELDVDGAHVLFSGDLGRPRHPLLPPPADPPSVRTVVVESTYGDREHPPPDDEILAAAVRHTAARGGTVLIPAFAVDRTELVLLELHRLMVAGRIPRLPVYVDSPMALASLEVYRRAQSGQHLTHGEASLFDLPEVHAVRDAEGSVRLNAPDFPCILVSASGMATGGRVVHHLRHQLPDPRNTVVLTGYQAVGTRGRQLAEGAPQVKLHGRYVPVHADIVSIPDFSVHADASEIVAWLARMATPPQTVYVVHGEPHSSSALATRIRRELGWTAVVPRLGERVRLD